MTANFRRYFGIVAAIGIISGLSIAATGTAQANTADNVYYYQGTGPTIEVTQDDRDSAQQFISMSADFGWKAEFTPAYGKQTMNQSVKHGKELGLQAVAQDLEDGKRVKLEGFSLGAVVVDDIARELDSQGVDLTNLEINVISGGRQPETGALVVLQPHADIMAMIGVTTTGPTATQTGDWTYHCIQYDAICDMVDPVVDPIGAAVRAVGYFTYHNGSDPIYNYGNRDNLNSQSTKIGNQTIVSYEAPNPVHRLVERTIDNLMNPTPVEEPTDPTVGTIPEEVITPQVPVTPVAPAAPPAPSQPVVDYPVVAPLEQQAAEAVTTGVQQAWEQAAPVIEQVAPEYVQPAIELAGQFGITLN